MYKHNRKCKILYKVKFKIKKFLIFIKLSIKIIIIKIMLEIAPKFRVNAVHNHLNTQLHPNSNKTTSTVPHTV